MVRQWCSSNWLASPVWIKKLGSSLPSDQISLALDSFFSWARCASYFGSVQTTSIAILTKAHSTNKKNLSVKICSTSWLWFTSNQPVHWLWMSKLRRISQEHFLSRKFTSLSKELTLTTNLTNTSTVKEFTLILKAKRKSSMTVMRVRKKCRL